jgi:hypothetical protein
MIAASAIASLPFIRMGFAMPYSPPAATSLRMRIAVSGQMIAQDMHAVQRSGSKHVAKGSPCLLNCSRDRARIFSGHALTQRAHPLHFSLSISGCPLDTDGLLPHDICPR